MSKSILSKRELIQGDILDRKVLIESVDFRRICRISDSFLVELIDEGIVEPDSEQGHFNGMQVQRAKKANRLRCDLGVNTPGIALILDLMERIERLENR